jgi:hypothetical protein
MNKTFDFCNFKITKWSDNNKLVSSSLKLEEYQELKEDIIFKVIGKSIFISYNRVNIFLNDRKENLIGWYYNDKKERISLIIKENETHFIIGCESIEKKLFKLQFLNIKKELNEQQLISNASSTNI